MDGLEQRKEECRDARRLNFIDDLLRISGMQDGRFAGVLALPRLPF